MDLSGKDTIVRRRMILTRATIAEEIFEKKGVDYMLTQLFTDGFTYELKTAQCVTEIVRELFIKWDDVVNVALSLDKFRELSVTFKQED